MLLSSRSTWGVGAEGPGFAGPQFPDTGEFDPPTGGHYDSAVDYSQVITIESGKRGGKPCIRGMRITVQDVLEYLAGGMTEDEIMADFSELTRQDIKACLAFAEIGRASCRERVYVLV